MAYKNDEDRRAYHKRWYQNNKEQRMVTKKRWEDSKRKLITEAKAGGCVDCGEDHPACLDFHHLRDKQFAIAQAPKNGCSVERLLEEIKKCIVLCANCHRKRHAILVQW